MVPSCFVFERIFSMRHSKKHYCASYCLSYLISFFWTGYVLNSGAFLDSAFSCVARFLGQGALFVGVVY